MIEGHSLQVGMSIGTALYPNDGTTPEILLRHADEAMYKAKKSGKNRISYYQSDPVIYCANTYII